MATRKTPAAKRGKTKMPPPERPKATAKEAGTSDKRPKLTPRQQQFVDEYLIDGNGTQAAIRAGYSEKTAYSIANENLNKPEIAAAIQLAMDQRAERTQIDADFVLQGITTAIRRCEQIEPVLDRKGDQVFVETPQGQMAAAFTYDAKNVLRGYELLGKHLKLFTDKVELTGKNGGPLETRSNEMTPEQRRDEIKRLLAENPGLIQHVNP
jgi:phage terminase small subunit